MYHYLTNLPVFGCFTVSLLIFVTILLWKVMNHEEKVVALEKKPRTKKCGKKGSCKKKGSNFQAVYAYFTSDATETLAREFSDYLGVKKVTYVLNDLRTSLNDKGQFNVHADGPAFFFIDEKAEEFEKWLAASDGKKLLNDYKFAVFDAGNFDIAVEYDKELWKLGAQRLQKISKDFDVWCQNMYKIVTGKSKIGCGCDGDDSSSCDSENDAVDKSLIVDVEDLLLEYGT